MAQQLLVRSLDISSAGPFRCRHFCTKSQSRNCQCHQPHSASSCRTNATQCQPSTVPRVPLWRSAESSFDTKNSPNDVTDLTSTHNLVALLSAAPHVPLLKVQCVPCGFRSVEGCSGSLLLYIMYRSCVLLSKPCPYAHATHQPNAAPHSCMRVTQVTACALHNTQKCDIALQ